MRRLRRLCRMCKSNRTCCFQTIHIDQFLPFHTNSNTCCRKYMDPGLLSFVQNIFHSFCIINCRLGVCHCHNSCETALFRSCSTGPDIFFISKTRITEMHMHIDQTRCHHHAVRIDHLIILCTCFRAADLKDLAAVDHYILNLIHSASRIDHTSILN